MRSSTTVVVAPSVFAPPVFSPFGFGGFGMGYAVPIGGGFGFSIFSSIFQFMFLALIVSVRRLMPLPVILSLLASSPFLTLLPAATDGTCHPLINRRLRST